MLRKIAIFYQNVLVEVMIKNRKFSIFQKYDFKQRFDF